MAGPYPVRVIVRTPGVIPGLAQISVRITGEPAPTLVTVRPLRWDAGLEGAPPADTARAVSGEAGLYSAELWLMTTGSYSVHISIAGDAGEGTVFIPVNAVAETRREMSRAMAVGLIGAALFLFVGAMTVFGAAVRESVLAPGVEPDRKQRLRGAVPRHDGPRRQVFRIDAGTVGDVQRSERVVIERRTGKDILPVLEGSITEIGQIAGRDLVEREHQATDVGAGSAGHAENERGSQSEGCETSHRKLLL